MNQTVIDQDGDWYVNTSANFAFIDGDTGVRFEPNVPTKVKQSVWMQSQPIIQPWADAPVPEPTQPAKIVQQVVPPKTPLDENPKADEKTTVTKA